MNYCAFKIQMWNFETSFFGYFCAYYYSRDYFPFLFTYTYISSISERAVGVSRAVLATPPDIKLNFFYLINTTLLSHHKSM